METNIIQYNQWELPTLNANSKAILFNIMQCGNASWHLRYVQCSQCLLWLEGANVFCLKATTVLGDSHCSNYYSFSSSGRNFSCNSWGVACNPSNSSRQTCSGSRTSNCQQNQRNLGPVKESNNTTRTTRARSPTRKHHKYYKCYQYYKFTSQQTNFKEGKSLFWNQLSSLGLCDICSIGLLVTWPQDDGIWWHLPKKTGNLSEKSIVLSPSQGDQQSS